MNNRVNYAGFLDLVLDKDQESDPDLHETLPVAAESTTRYSMPESTLNMYKQES